MVLGHRQAICKGLPQAAAAKSINARQHFQPEHEKLDALIRDNVVAQLTNLRTHPSIALALTQGKLRLHGWVYDIETGQIDALDGRHRPFRVARAVSRRLRRDERWRARPARPVR